MKGVLLINLGSTKSPDKEDVKTYLDEFLMDERALDLPYWLRALIVRGIILKTRPAKTAANYQRIWWKEGSPLIVLSERTKEKLQKQLKTMPVAIGMRYGQPSIKSGLQELYEQKVSEVILLPMYPHYTMATIETAVVEAQRVQKELFPEMKLTTIPPFYQDPDYIRLLAKSVQEKVATKEIDYLLFSYHGIPRRHERKSNFKINGQKITYEAQCLKTTALVAQELNLKPEQYGSSFQSRLGIDRWIQPFTTDKLKELAQSNKRNIAMIAPSFVADCIETLDELEREAKEDFINAGGGSFTYIPCLNDRSEWIELIEKWIVEFSE